MFGKTVVTKLAFDPITGLAKTVVSSVEKDMVAGTLAGITSHLTTDEVVTGIGRTLGAVVVAYGSAQLASKSLQGQFALNPYKAG